MKFNKQELSNLACQSSNRFIKEGALVVYEKQDGVIFKRNESKSKRLPTYFLASIWFVLLVN
jgi:hypothetical protein